jgi:pimeloyl-ACP methyl ester carboxylesterase
MNRSDSIPSSSNVHPLRVGAALPAAAKDGGRGSAEHIGWLLRSGPAPVDVTRAFSVMAATAEAGTDPLPAEARRLAYVFVGEPLGSFIPGYLQENLQPFRERGFHTRLLPVLAGADAATGARNVMEVVRRIAEAGRRVVVVGHGRGAVDALDALSLYPELTPAVRALVALQAPFGGSPLASDVAEVGGPLLPVLSGPLAALVRRHPATLQDSTYAARQAFVARHPPPVGLPVVCLSTSRHESGSPLYGSEEYLFRRYGQRSDGVVLAADAVLPGTRHVVLEGLDHVETVMASAGCNRPYAPAELTVGLVALALRSPAPTAHAVRAAAA